MILKLTTSYKIRSIILLLSAALAVWFFIMAANRFAIRPKADENSVSTQFNPGSMTVDVESSRPFLFSIATVAGSGINGIDAVFNVVGPIKLRQTQEIASSSTETTFTSLIKTTNRFSYTIVSQREELPSTVSIPFDVECTDAGQATVELDRERSQFLGTAAGNIFGIDATNTLSVDCGGVGTFGAAARATASFEKAVQSALVGQPLNYRLLLNPSGVTGVSAFNLNLKFDPNIVEVVEVAEPAVGVIAPPLPANAGPAGSACTTDDDCPSLCLDTSQPGCQMKCVGGVCQPATTGGGGGGGTNPTPTGNTGGGGDDDSSTFVKVKNDVDPTAGTIQLAYVVKAEDNQLPHAVMIEIVLKGKKNGSGKLEFLTAQMTGDVDDSDYNVSKTDAQYSFGEQGGGDDGGDPKTINLNLKLRLQGIVTKPKTKSSIPVKVGLGDGGLTEATYQTGNFTPDANGIWSGSVTFEVPPGDGYKVLIKPPHHLQKRVCDADPDEQDNLGYYNCDQGNIELEEGDNNFDFTGAAILVGDLPEQDGIVNARDRVQCSEDIGLTAQDALERSDVNYDGGINQIDCSAILYSMTIRYDEK